MTGRGALPLLGLALPALVACAPLSVDQAERVCLDQARDATGPRTEMGMGIGSGGYRGGFVQVGLSSDYIMGRDPSKVFADCVQRRSGQKPTRPLYDQPGWGAR
ncbi:MAG: hypothetical protein QM682_11435 [Paracoccus sp. (in: a-proteobacteria)]|uniref:hypothetical protein n=1 Tax=Paracoccus sp. TaxID=267 RepID=UPI0039E6C9D3